MVFDRHQSKGRKSGSLASATKAATVCAACQLANDGILVRMLSEAAAQAAGVIRASSARRRRRSSVLAGEGIGFLPK